MIIFGFSFFVLEILLSLLEFNNVSSPLEFVEDFILYTYILNLSYNNKSFISKKIHSFNRIYVRINILILYAF